MSSWCPLPLLISVTESIWLWDEGTLCPDQESKSFFFRVRTMVHVDLSVSCAGFSCIPSTVSSMSFLHNSQMFCVLLRASCSCPQCSPSHPVTGAGPGRSRHSEMWPGSSPLWPPSSLSRMNKHPGTKFWERVHSNTNYSFVFLKYFYSFSQRKRINEANRACFLEYIGDGW